MTQDQLLEILIEDVVAAGPALLGSTLVRGKMRSRIVEVEAYRSDDPACHAFRSRTLRNEVMYGPAGRSYVYFNYGVHWMLNIVAHDSEDPAALLIRAAVPEEGIDEMLENRPVKELPQLLSGPGKLAQAYRIEGRHTGINLLDLQSEIHIEAAKAPSQNVLIGPRIGLAKGKWEDVCWRFVDGDWVKWVLKRAGLSKMLDTLPSAGLPVVD